MTTIMPHARPSVIRGADGSPLYSLSELEQRTGATRRQLQSWADAGAIESTPETQHGGTGNHRLFPRAELQIAAILTPLAAAGLTIGVLVRVGGILRQALDWEPGKVPRVPHYGAQYMKPGEHFEEGVPDIRRAIDRAMQRGSSWLAIACTREVLWLEAITDEDAKEDRKLPMNRRLDRLVTGTDHKAEVVVMVDLAARLAKLLDT
jgi:DNA-binding transcriptional MerR regulator